MGLCAYGPQKFLQVAAEIPIKPQKNLVIFVAHRHPGPAHYRQIIWRNLNGHAFKGDGLCYRIVARIIHNNIIRPSVIAVPIATLIKVSQQGEVNRDFSSWENILLF